MHAVTGGVRAVWGASGWETGAYGYPTTDMICGLAGGGCGQQFQGGAIYWSPATGVHAITGGIRAVWGASGWETGAYGYPTTDMICGLAGGGCGQQFQGGAIYWSPATGVHAVTGGIRAVWGASGWETGARLPHDRHDLRPGRRRLRPAVPGRRRLLVPRHRRARRHRRHPRRLGRLRLGDRRSATPRPT